MNEADTCRKYVLPKLTKQVGMMQLFFTEQKDFYRWKNYSRKKWI